MIEQKIKGTIIMETDQASVSKSVGALKKITDTLNAIQTQAQNKGAVAGIGTTMSAEMKKVEQSTQAVKEALAAAFNPKLNTFNLQKVDQELKKSGLTIKDLGKLWSQMGEQGRLGLTQVTNALTQTQSVARKTTGVFDKLGESMANTVRWKITSGLLNNFTGSIQQAWGYTKALDTSLNNIRIVTGKSADEMERFAKSANKTAKSLSASTTAYTDAALIYYQQGLGDKEAQTRAAITVKAANVTGQSAAEVSEQLTAVWNGYKVVAEEAELYVDKLAAVAASTAADLEELSDGMSKVASAANAMGVDIDQLSAQLATIVSVTRQDAASVGTALKTIFARMGDLKVDGVDEFGVSLGDVSGQMKQMGIDVLDQQGNLRDMGDVMEEVAKKWGTWTDAQQQAAAVAMAGKRQYNNLIALFENWDMYESSLATAQGAEGTLEKQNKTYQESIKAMLQEVKTAAEGFKGELFDTESIEKVTDLLQGLFRTLEHIASAFGGLKNMLPLILGMMMKLAPTFQGTLVKGAVDIGKSFGNMFSSNKKIKKLTQHTQESAAALNDYNEKLKAVNENQKKLNQDKRAGKISKEEYETATEENQKKKGQLTAITRAYGNRVKIEEMHRKGLIDDDKYSRMRESNEAIISNVEKIGKEKVHQDEVNANPLMPRGGTALATITSEAKENKKNGVQEKDLLKNNKAYQQFTKIIIQNNKEVQKNVAKINNLSSVKKKTKRNTDALAAALKNFSQIEYLTPEQQAELDALSRKLQESKKIVNKETAQEISDAVTRIGQESTDAFNELHVEAQRAAEGVDDLGQAEEALEQNSENLNNEMDGVSALSFGDNLATLTSNAMMAVGAFGTLTDAITGMQEGTTSVADGIMGIGGSVLTVLPVIMSSINSIKMAGMGAGFSIQAAFGWVSLALTGLTAIFSIGKLFTKKKKKGPTEAEEAQKSYEQVVAANKRLQEQLNETKDAYSELVDNISDYREARLAIDKLRVGTEEWKQSVQELNFQVLSLVQKYPLLQKYLSWSKEGVAEISPEGFDELLLSYQKSIQKQSTNVFLSQAAAISADNKRLKAINNALNKDSFKAYEDFSELAPLAGLSFLIDVDADTVGDRGLNKIDKFEKILLHEAYDDEIDINLTDEEQIELSNANLGISGMTWKEYQENYWDPFANQQVVKTLPDEIDKVVETIKNNNNEIEKNNQAIAKNTKELEAAQQAFYISKAQEYGIANANIFADVVSSNPRNNMFLSPNFQKKLYQGQKDRDDWAYEYVYGELGAGTLARMKQDGKQNSVEDRASYENFFAQYMAQITGKEVSSIILSSSDADDWTNYGTMSAQDELFTAYFTDGTSETHNWSSFLRLLENSETNRIFDDMEQEIRSKMLANQASGQSAANVYFQQDEDGNFLASDYWTNKSGTEIFNTDKFIAESGVTIGEAKSVYSSSYSTQVNDMKKKYSEEVNTALNNAGITENLRWDSVGLNDFTTEGVYRLAALGQHAQKVTYIDDNNNEITASSALNALLEKYQNDPDKIYQIVEILSANDWTTSIGMTAVLDAFEGIDIKVNTIGKDWDAFIEKVYNGNLQWVESLTNVRNVLGSIESIIGDISAGDSISQEDYDELMSLAPDKMYKYFVRGAGDTWIATSSGATIQADLKSRYKDFKGLEETYTDLSTAAMKTGARGNYSLNTAEMTTAQLLSQTLSYTGERYTDLFELLGIDQEQFIEARKGLDKKLIALQKPSKEILEQFDEDGDGVLSQGERNAYLASEGLLDDQQFVSNSAEKINQALIDAQEGNFSSDAAAEVYATSLATSWQDMLDSGIFESALVTQGTKDKITKLWGNKLRESIGVSESFGQATDKKTAITNDELNALAKDIHRRELDYYAEVNAALDQIGATIDRAFGQGKLNKLKEQTSLLKGEYAIAQTIQTRENSTLNTLVNETFLDDIKDANGKSVFPLLDGDGNLVLNEVLEAMLSEDEAIATEAKTIFDAYMAAEEAAVATEEAANKVLDNQIETWKLSFEIRNNFFDVLKELKTRQFELSKWTTIANAFNEKSLDDIYNENIVQWGLSKNKIGSVGSGGLLDQFLAYGNDDEGVKSTTYTYNEAFNEAAYMEDWGDSITQIYDEIGNMQDAATAMYDAWISGQEQLMALYDDEIEKLSTLNDILQGTAEMWKLVKKNAEGYAEGLKGFYASSIAGAEASYQLSMAKFEQAKSQYEKITGAGTEASDEMIRIVTDNYYAAMAEVSNQAQAWADIIATAFTESMSAAFDEVVIAAAGMDLTGLSESWELEKAKEELFLDDVNRAYALGELERKIQSSIDATDSLSAQRTLNELKERELNILKSKGKLSQYEIDRANAMYELTLKQIALEEAQQTANKMKLTRDASGNYTYQYVADENAIAQAEEELAAAQNELYNLDKDRKKELIDSWFSYMSDYQSKMSEAIASGNTALQNEIQEAYFGSQGFLTVLASQLGIVEGNAEGLKDILGFSFDMPFDEMAKNILSVNIDDLGSTMGTLMTETNDSLGELNTTVQGAFGTGSKYLSSITEIKNAISSSGPGSLSNAASSIAGSVSAIYTWLKANVSTISDLNSKVDTSGYEAALATASDATARLTTAAWAIVDALDNGSQDGSVKSWMSKNGRDAYDAYLAQLGETNEE